MQGREYKFRAWLKNEKKMVDVTLISFNSKGIMYLNKKGKQKVELFENIELMQYTGLKDKNGVEIYEGDIVKCEDSPYSFKIGVAEFNDTDVGSCGCCYDAFFGAGFVIKTVKIKNDNGTYFSLYDLAKCEVIGNVWEHKHLLGGQNDS